MLSFQWAGQVFCLASVTFNMLLLAKLHSYTASQVHWKLECAKSAYIDINTPHHIINIFGKNRPIDLLSCIQKNHHQPESTAGSGLHSLAFMSFRKCWLCIATHVRVWRTEQILCASSSRVQTRGLCTGLKELPHVSQTSITVHVCMFNLFQFKLLSSSFQLNGITSHLGQTKSIQGKQLPRLPRFSWHVVICCAAATCSCAKNTTHRRLEQSGGNEEPCVKTTLIL